MLGRAGSDLEVRGLNGTQQNLASELSQEEVTWWLPRGGGGGWRGGVAT